MNAPRYWRNNKHWSAELGRRGTVLASSFIRVAPAGLESFVPYSLAIVEFDTGERNELMGVPGQELQPGDQVQCVWRRTSTPDKQGIIAYGIKVIKV